MDDATSRASSNRKNEDRTPRAKKVPGWGSRFRRIRLRFDLSLAEVARRVGYSPSSVGDWESSDVMPGAAAIKGFVRSGATWDVDRALSWLADGEGREPYWLAADPGLDPRKPPKGFAEGAPPRPPAMPLAILEHIEGARGGLAGLVAESGGRVPGAVFRALAELEDGLRMIPSAALPRLDSNQDKEAYQGSRRRPGAPAGELLDMARFAALAAPASKIYTGRSARETA